VPLGLALADYRDRLASTYDLRLASFQVGLAVRGGAEVCTLWAAGTHPPDGRAFSTCVEVRGGAPCGPGAADGVTRLEPAGAERRRLRECFSGG
jgi:hypothetical protein